MGYPALSSVSAQCVGAGDYKQVRYYTKKLWGIPHTLPMLGQESSYYNGAFV